MKTTASHPHLLLGRAIAKAATQESIVDTGEGHLVTIAPTGAGKGVSCAIPALLTWSGPAIVVDPKGENYAVTAAHRRKIGQKVCLLDPFDVTRSGPSRDRLNPLDLIKADAPTFGDDASMLARLICADRSLKEPYWDERAQALITGLIMDTVRHKTFDLGFVREMVEAEPAGRFSRMFTDSEDVPLVTDAVATGIFRMSAAGTRCGIVSTAASHTSFLRAGPVLKSLTGSTISLKEVKSGQPMTIYLVLPPEKLQSHGKLLRLWIGVFISTIARRRHIPEMPTLFLIDEAAQLGELQELRTAITLLRGYGVKVWSFWQDLSQLKRLYEDWETILNNCAVQQFFGLTSPHAAASLDVLMAGSVPFSTADLKPGEAVLIRPGHKPAKVLLPDYRTEPQLASRAAPNPFYRFRPLPPVPGGKVLKLVGRSRKA